MTGRARIFSMTQKAPPKPPSRNPLTFLMAGLGAVLAPVTASAKTPEPTYTLVSREGAFEIRDYAPQVVAEVRVQEGKGDPANEGFRPLAGYIFGGNAPRTKIAMTAPVTRQKGTKIAMTAPVTRQAVGSEWQVRFIMPAGSTLANMPKPNDPRVQLMEEPGKRYGVIRFSGLARNDALAAKTNELKAMMATRRLTGVGAPVIALYDPPWTLPSNRRNEIWIEIQKP
ncbi:MAG: hypothetical protein RLZZ157_391 [Pseudomonadota bacterium]